MVAVFEKQALSEIEVDIEVEIKKKEGERMSVWKCILPCHSALCFPTTRTV